MMEIFSDKNKLYLIGLINIDPSHNLSFHFSSVNVEWNCDYKHFDQVSPPQNMLVTMYTMNNNKSPITKYILTFRQNKALAKFLLVLRNETA